MQILALEKLNWANSGTSGWNKIEQTKSESADKSNNLMEMNQNKIKQNAINGV